MKKLILLSALALAGVATLPAYAAGTAVGNFNVSVNLTSACRINTGSATALDFGTYAAFGGPTVSAPTASIKFDCTRGLAISSVAFDTGSGDGVVAGLQYTMTVAPVVRTAGTAATSSSVGTADLLDYVVTGTMATGQAGTGAGGTTQTSARTLTISY